MKIKCVFGNHTQNTQSCYLTSNPIWSFHYFKRIKCRSYYVTFSRLVIALCLISWSKGTHRERECGTLIALSAEINTSSSSSPPCPSLPLILAMSVGGALSLLRTITSSQIPIHPHKDRLMFPPSPQTIPQCSNIPSLWAPSPLFHRFSIPKCPAEWCLNRYVRTLIDYGSNTAKILS